MNIFALPLVSVVIVSYNRRDELRKCVLSAQKQTYKPLEIVVVDNYSESSIIDMLRTEFPDIRVIRLHRNFGWPFAKNVASLNIKGEYIYFLDDDLYCFPDAIEKMIEIMKQHPEVGIVTGQTIDPDSGKHGRLNERFHVNDKEGGGYTTSIYGGHSLMRREVLEKIGFYPDHSRYGGLDRAITLKALDQRIFTYYCPEAYGYHVVTETARDRNKNFRILYRNAIHIAWELYPLLLAIGMFFISVWRFFKASIRKKFILDWFIVTPTLPWLVLLTLVKYRKKPISYRTVALFRYINSKCINSLEQINPKLVKPD